MKTPERILWPTDFSELSLKAGRHAQGYRDLFKAELHVIHVCSPAVAPNIEPWLPNRLRATNEELLEAARLRLSEVVAEHLDNDPAIVCATLMGSPWLKTCEYAEGHDIDLIIVATHGTTGARHILLGSTTERIVHHAPCPVLTLKCHERVSKGG